MKKIDAKGLACPAPVLQIKAAIEKESPQEIQVAVDNDAAKQNVSRFLKSQGYDIHEVRPDGNGFEITGKREGAKASPSVKKSDERLVSGTNKIMVMATTDRLGFGDDELGKKLMVNFIKTLKEIGPELWRIIFVNNGVKLTTEGSTVLPVLMELETAGCHILVCGTCLEHFKLLDKKKVGETTNMLDIVTSMQLADKVIHI